jgi:predicted component of type VI protein secretion system
MTLVLQGIALDEQPMSQPLIGRFDERGGTLGRSDTVTSTLPDPERMISRIQAQVLHRDEGYWLENVSAANPILHNGRPLSSGMRVLLREGDELRVGGYTQRAAFEQNPTSATILRGRTAITHPNASSGAAALSAPSEPLTEGTRAWTQVPEQRSSERMSTARAALEAVFDRFDPAKLEASLGKPSVFESMLPARHKARLWALYLERFRSLRRQAQEDLQRLFGAQ